MISVCGLCILLILGIIRVTTTGIPVPYTDKKIGPWIGVSEKSIAPATYVQNVFNKIPFYSVIMIQTGVSGTLEGVDWAKNVGIEASKLNKPEIEISVVYGFNQNIRDENNWIAFQNVVNTLTAGKPAIKYIGIEGEFFCGSCTPQPSSTEIRGHADRLRTIVEAAGFQVIHWFLGDLGASYPTIHGTSFPTWCDNAYVLNWFQEASQVGMEIGVTAGRISCASIGGSYDAWLADKDNAACGCDWTQELVNWVIDKAHTISAANRHFNLLAGPMLDPTTGKSRDTAYYWNDDFRNWVWQRQQLYPEFTWVGKSGGTPPLASPHSYLAFVFRNASQLPVLLPEMTWKLFDGTQEVAYTPGTYSLDSYKTYVLRTYYGGYLIKENQIDTLNQTVDVRLSLFQQNLVPGGQIAFDKPLSALTLVRESNDMLAFDASSSFTGHLIVVKSPRTPYYVWKDGMSYANWSFDPGSNVTVITTETLGSWAISFATPPPPPPQPPPPIFLPRELFPYNLLMMGFVIGILPFVLVLLARRRDVRYKVSSSA